MKDRRVEQVLPRGGAWYQWKGEEVGKAYGKLFQE
jgi:hypothetical protein